MKRLHLQSEHLSTSFYLHRFLNHTTYWQETYYHQKSKRSCEYSFFHNFPPKIILSLSRMLKFHYISRYLNTHEYITILNISSQLVFVQFATSEQFFFFFFCAFFTYVHFCVLHVIILHNCSFIRRICLKHI